jgi:hypothetical protein
MAIGDKLIPRYGTLLFSPSTAEGGTMPYYVYRITQPTPIIKNLELKSQFDTYPQARDAVRDLRASALVGESATYKLVHAASELEAEELLQTPREKPVLMEWEK